MRPSPLPSKRSGATASSRSSGPHNPLPPDPGPPPEREKVRAKEKGGVGADKWVSFRVFLVDGE